MRYFFRRRIPEAARILLVESGSRRPLELALPALRRYFGEAARFDVFTCFAGCPEGLCPEATAIFQIHQYRRARLRLLREIARGRYAVMGMLCSDEPVLSRWKWLLAAWLPAKVFVINENGDYFWLDWGHWANIRHFVKYRAGIAGSSALRTLGSALLFPLVFFYLLLYATAVHLRRALRGGTP